MPVGYDLGEDGRLIPSTRLVAELGMTEADMVRSLFARIANSETTLSREQHRLHALGVSRFQRYGGVKGRVIERSGK